MEIILLFKGPTCPLLKPPLICEIPSKIAPGHHLNLSLSNNEYYLYIFGDTDVGLLCWLSEKQNIHVSFPFILCHLRGGWGICNPDQKIVIIQTFHKKA